MNREVVYGWDLSRVRQYLINKKGLDPLHVDRCIVEYRRFVILTVENPKEKVPIAGPVDEVWHTHILFTENYCAFGQAVAGGYIHHLPTVNEEEVNALSGFFESNTIRLYMDSFDEIDRTLWGENSQVCLCRGIDSPTKVVTEVDVVTTA